MPRPGPGEVLVKVAAIGVNPVDTYWRSGLNPQIKPPYTPGLDAAGVVESAGAGVKKFSSGDRVYTAGSLTGAYAEFCLCREDQVFALPSETTFEEGASLGVPYATAYRALFHRGNLRPSETLLVHGASGGVGLAAIQFARAAGAFIIGTAGTDRGRSLVRDQGAQVVLDHTSPGYLEQIKKATVNRGVDLILEMLANVNLGRDLPLLAQNGRVVVIGSRGNIEITPRDLMSRDADIRGMSLFNATPQELASIHAEIRAGLEMKTLKPIIGTVLPLSEAASSHVKVMEPGAHGKIILKP